MDEGRRCNQCGAVLPSDGPTGFCPNCVIGVVDEDVPAPRSPPTPEPQRRLWTRTVAVVVGAGTLLAAVFILLWAGMPAQAPPRRSGSPA